MHHRYNRAAESGSTFGRSLYICVYVRSTCAPGSPLRRVFLLYRVDNRIHAYSTKKRPFWASAEVLANHTCSNTTFVRWEKNFSAQRFPAESKQRSPGYQLAAIELFPPRSPVAPTRFSV